MIPGCASMNLPAQVRVVTGELSMILAGMNGLALLPDMESIERTVSDAEAMNTHLQAQGFRIPSVEYAADPLGFIVDMARFYQKIERHVSPGTLQ